MDKERVFNIVGNLLVYITCPYLFLFLSDPFKTLCEIGDRNVGKEAKEADMDCIYNTGGYCYRDAENITECPYAGDGRECEGAEEG